MYSKILLITACILTSGQTFAEETTSKKALNYIKEKFSASFHGELNFMRRDSESDDSSVNKIQDLGVMYNPTINYAPTENWKLSATAEFKYIDHEVDADWSNSFYRALFTLTRKNILTEKENRLYLDAGIARRQYNTGDVPLNYGNNRVFVNLSKKINKHEAGLNITYLKNDPKNPTDSTWEDIIELIPQFTYQFNEKLSLISYDDINYFLPRSSNTPKKSKLLHELNGILNYQWNDKFGSYYQLQYNHLETFTNSPKTDYFVNVIGASFTLNPKVAFTAELSSNLFRHNDGKNLFAKDAAKPDIGLYVDLSI